MSDFSFQGVSLKKKTDCSFGPTSPDFTTNLARRPGWTNSGYVRSLRRRASTPSLAAAPRLCSADTSVVSTIDWQPVDHYLQPSSVVWWHRKVKVSNEQVGCNSAAGLPTNACHGALQSKPTSSQNPCLRAGAKKDASDGEGALGTTGTRSSPDHEIDGASPFRR